MNPITAKLAEISPTYEPHGAQNHHIRTAEDAQAIADAIPAKIAAYRKLAEREVGPDVFEINDLLACISLHGPGAINPDVSTLSRMMGNHLGEMRAFELGQKSAVEMIRRAPWIVALYVEHDNRLPDVEGFDAWIDALDAGHSQEAVTGWIIDGFGGRREKSD